jgi:hypothetical protein
MATRITTTVESEEGDYIMELGDINTDELIEDMNYYLNVPQRPAAMDLPAKTTRISINCAYDKFIAFRDYLRDNPPNDKEESAVATASVSRLRALFAEFNSKRSRTGGNHRRSNTRRRRHTKKKTFRRRA